MLRALPVLLLALALGACTGEDAGPPQDEAGWRVAQQTDSTGTVHGVFMILDAVASPEEARGPTTSLVVRCDGGQLAAYVYWRTDLGRDTVQVAYILDEEPTETADWLASSDRQAAGRWSDSLAAPFVTRLAAHDVLRTTVAATEDTLRSTFELAGLSDALPTLQETCPW